MIRIERPHTESLEFVLVALGHLSVRTETAVSLLHASKNIRFGDYNR